VLARQWDALLHGFGQLCLVSGLYFNATVIKVAKKLNIGRDAAGLDGHNLNRTFMFFRYQAVGST
jgi:hypothetical protein